MQRWVFDSPDLPEYHDNLLIVQLASPAAGEANGDVPREAMAFGGSGRAPTTSIKPETSDRVRPWVESDGFKALLYHARAGLLRSVQPVLDIPESRVHEAAPGIGAALARLPWPEAFVEQLFSTASVSDGIEAELGRGVSFLEFDTKADLAKVQRALARTSQVISASQVPYRYLLGTSAPHRLERTGHRLPPRAPTGALAIPWNLKAIEWEAARADDHVEPTDIKVAILDSGIDQNHPDLAGRIRNYHWSAPPPYICADKDIVGHGTHVAGIIAGAVNQTVGTAGICQTNLYVWKIFDDTPVYRKELGYYAYIVNPIMYLRALNQCAAERVDVLNLSIGGRARPSPSEEQAINMLLANDTTIVAAMGNNRRGGSDVLYPAAMTDVIAVGATRPDDRVADFSNRGAHIWISAPGVAIWSTLPTYPGQSGFQARSGSDGTIVEGKAIVRERDYDAWDGTSMAAPHVTAAVALLMARKGRLNTMAVRDALREGVDAVAGMGSAIPHPDYGYGRLNLKKLLRRGAAAKPMLE